MLIAKTDMKLSSKHDAESSTLRQLKLAEMPRSDSAFQKLLDQQMQSPPAQLLTIETGAATAPQGGGNHDRGPFEAIMEMLFGLPHMAAGTAADGEAPEGLPLKGRGFTVMELVHTSESESCTFAASGNVCLADGSTRDFNVGYHMERHEESTSLGVGTFRDPLMLDFGAPENKFGANAIEFDIDADGDVERMKMPTGNTSVLFIDRNHNGKADDGSELFGAKSGDGFADLAKLDSDGNGWIDEGDAAFADLKLWNVGQDGESTVKTFAEAGIGALATQSAATEFTIKDGGEAVGQQRASSVWLGETGGAGLVRQVDLAILGGSNTA